MIRNIKKHLVSIIIFLWCFSIYKSYSQDIVKLIGGKMYKHKSKYVLGKTKKNIDIWNQVEINEKIPYGKYLEISFDKFFKKGIIKYINSSGNEIKIPFNISKQDNAYKGLWEYYDCIIEGKKFQLQAMVNDWEKKNNISFSMNISPYEKVFKGLKMVNHDNPFEWFSIEDLSYQ